MCFNIIDIDIYKCNEFDYTSFHFCKRYPHCSYDFNTNKCLIKEIPNSLNCLDDNSNDILY